MTIDEYLEFDLGSKQAFVVNGNIIHDIDKYKCSNILEQFMHLDRHLSYSDKYLSYIQKIHYELSAHQVHLNGLLMVISDVIMVYNMITNCEEFHDQNVLRNYITKRYNRVLYKYRRDKHHIRFVYQSGDLMDKWEECTERYLTKNYCTEQQSEIISIFYNAW